MGYMKIPNLYKEQAILNFKEGYCLEKIHGTSAHIGFKDGSLRFFSGGANHESFLSLFDFTKLYEKCSYLQIKDLTIYGEAYGGKMQGMSHTYGKELKFVAFDVCIGSSWLDVPSAHSLTETIGLEFVDYAKIQLNMAEIDAQRDRPSVQAFRNGMGEDKIREGVVIRPIIEAFLSDGGRIIAKHKREEFRETASTRAVKDPKNLDVLKEAKVIAEEWVTEMRLSHVLDKINTPQTIENTGIVVKAVFDDIVLESANELLMSNEAKKAIGQRAASLYKRRIQLGMEAQ